MDWLELRDILIALVAFVIGFLVGVGSKVELKQLWLGRKRHGKKK